jgi:hypothetical protein
MLRSESESGWWLITHPDHARLAGEFAASWGNEHFRKPEPRARVLHGIASHDDGWTIRDAHPKITRQGKPSAFSTELVGKYSAFEEIDLAEYLAVRERAVRLIAEEDPYAALLIALHTYNLLTEHADRSTIASAQLPLLDSFLESQSSYQRELIAAIDTDPSLDAHAKNRLTIHQHFQLLQACDNLSLLACVAYDKPSHLLHALPLNDGGVAEVTVHPITPRRFRLNPWPFAEALLAFSIQARHVLGHVFDSSDSLDQAFQDAPIQSLSITLIS